MDRYEEAVAIAVNICNKPHVKGDCTFSAITGEVLDSCMKLELSLQEENVDLLRYFTYHLLAYCYIKVGVSAEICLPVVLHHPDKMAESFFKESTKLFGYQLVSVRKLQEAFNWFDKIPELGLVPYNIRYAAMLYIVSKQVSTLKTKTSSGISMATRPAKVCQCLIF